MSSQDPLIGFQHYDPYLQGWYLLPGGGDVKVPSSLAASTAASGLTIDQINELNSHTIQGLIELLYVRVGNDVLYQGLSGLDQSLYQTNRTLSLLATIQELHNSLSVSSMGSLSSWFIYNGNYSDEDAGNDLNHYQANYNSAASAFFGIPVMPDFIFKHADSVVTIQGQQVSFDDFSAKLASVKSQLASDLNLLLLQDPSAANQNDSLYASALQVLCDLPPAQNNTSAVTWTDAKLWALDYYTVDNGVDYAQADYNPAAPNAPWQTIFTVSSPFNELIVPNGTDGSGNNVYRAVSMSPGNMAGLGSGEYVGGGRILDSSGQQAQSFRVGPLNPFQTDITFDGSLNMPGGATLQTYMLTFSGRMAFTRSLSDGESGASQVGKGDDAGMNIIKMNPINEQGQVERGIGSSYLGDAATRGQQGANAGIFQQNITTAITAAQGLNNSQTETVKAFLNTFEEYYKSASSLLTSMTSLISGFAQNIRPS